MLFGIERGHPRIGAGKGIGLGARRALGHRIGLLDLHRVEFGERMADLIARRLEPRQLLLGGEPAFVAARGTGSARDRPLRLGLIAAESAVGSFGLVEQRGDLGRSLSALGLAGGAIVGVTGLSMIPSIGRAASEG